VPPPLGRTIRLTPIRKLMGDFLALSRRVPIVSIERRMNLGAVVAARAGAADRPSWFAIFMKAFGAVSAVRPELRQSCLTFPTERVFESRRTVANLAVARTVDGTDGVLRLTVRDPERLPLPRIDAHIRRARSAPLDEVPEFRRALFLGRFPKFIRRLVWWVGLEVIGKVRVKQFGTFGMTGVSALGSASLNLLTPVNTITFGVIEPDGSVTVRFFYDHRLLDGVIPAKTLEDLETVLRTTIRDELNALPRVRQFLAA
jgi:hypothetical protein